MRKNNTKNSKFISFTLCMLLGIFAWSCTSPQSLNMMQERKPIYTSKPFEDYRLQHDDEITCSILTSNSDIAAAFNGIVSTSIGGSAATYTIYENGNISIPFFGEIHIAGASIPEAEDIIEKAMRLAVPDAQVRVFLKNNQFYIVSESQRGMYPIYKENMTIFQALANAGVPDGRMLNIDKIQILRTDPITGKTIQKEFDIRTVSIIESEFYYIKPNDLIYLATSSKSFFRIDSFQSVLSTITAPISFILMLLAFKVKI